MNREEFSARQDADFAALKDEFSRIQQQEKSLRKACGLPEEGKTGVSESELTPEVRAEYEELKAKAQREGAARAAQYQASASDNSGNAASVPGSRRQGVMRI